MFSKKVHRTLPILLAVTFLALPGLAQAHSYTERGSASLFDLFQQRIAELASALWGGIAGAWEKEGAAIDPSGTPGTGSGNGTGTTGGSTTDGGASIDPSGTPGNSGSGNGSGS